METFSKDMLDAARGLKPADAVFKNACIFNSFTCGWERGTLGVKNGLVLGISTIPEQLNTIFGFVYYSGFYRCSCPYREPLLVPREYARLVDITVRLP